MRIHPVGLDEEQESVWQTAVDPASGNTYYHNTDTGETQWECPSELVGVDSHLRVHPMTEEKKEVKELGRIQIIICYIIFAPVGIGIVGLGFAIIAFCGIFFWLGAALNHMFPPDEERDEHGYKKEKPAPFWFTILFLVVPIPLTAILISSAGDGEGPFITTNFLAVYCLLVVLYTLEILVKQMVNGASSGPLIADTVKLNPLKHDEGCKAGCKAVIGNWLGLLGLLINMVQLLSFAAPSDDYPEELELKEIYDIGLFSIDSINIEWTLEDHFNFKVFATLTVVSIYQLLATYALEIGSGKKDEKEKGSVIVQVAPADAENGDGTAKEKENIVPFFKSEKFLYLMSFLGEILFFPLISNLFEATDCVENEVDSGIYVRRMASSQSCFDSPNAITWLTVTGGMSYVVSSLLVQTKVASRDVNKNQLEFSMNYVMFNKICKMILVGVKIYIRDDHVTQTILTSITFFVDFIVCIGMLPCPYWPAAYWKGAVSLCCVWATLCSGMANSFCQEYLVGGAYNFRGSDEGMQPFYWLWAGSGVMLAYFMFNFLVGKCLKKDDRKYGVLFGCLRDLKLRDLKKSRHNAGDDPKTCKESGSDLCFKFSNYLFCCVMIAIFFMLCFALSSFPPNEPNYPKDVYMVAPNYKQQMIWAADKIIKDIEAFFMGSGPPFCKMTRQEHYDSMEWYDVVVTLG